MEPVRRTLHLVQGSALPGELGELPAGDTVLFLADPALDWDLVVTKIFEHDRVRSW